MKQKSIFSIINLIPGSIIVFNFLVLTSCKKQISEESIITLKDTISPVITLIGDNDINLGFNSVWVDPGYTALDNIEGDITSKVKVFGNVNTHITGRYLIYYDVHDEANNIDERKRAVYVGIDSSTIVPPVSQDFLCGVYRFVSGSPDAPGDSIGKIEYNQNFSSVVLNHFFGGIQSTFAFIESSTADSTFKFSYSSNHRKGEWIITGTCKLNNVTNELHLNFYVGWGHYGFLDGLDYFEETYIKLQ